MNCGQLLQKGMIWEVGKGSEISFWYNNWIETRCLIELMDLDDDVNLNPAIKVSEFTQNS